MNEEQRREATRRKLEEPFYVVEFRIGGGDWTRSGGMRRSESWAVKEGKRLALIPAVSAVRVERRYPPIMNKAPEEIYTFGG